jgi:hypothetical protein
MAPTPVAGGWSPTGVSADAPGTALDAAGPVSVAAVSAGGVVRLVDVVSAGEGEAGVASTGARKAAGADGATAFDSASASIEAAASAPFVPASPPAGAGRSMGCSYHH